MFRESDPQMGGNTHGGSVDTKPAFSWGTAIGFAASHLLLTYVFAVAAFVQSMGAFNHDVRGGMAFWNVVMWIWSPWARVCFSLRDPDLVTVKLLALLWSAFIGVLAGLFRAQIGRVRL